VNNSLWLSDISRRGTLYCPSAVPVFFISWSKDEKEPQLTITSFASSKRPEGKKERERKREEKREREIERERERETGRK
jgi:hypothetical protein